MNEFFKTKGVKSILVFLVLVVCCSIFVRCTRVDSSEVGIKFNKLSLTEQGTLDATPVTGYVFYLWGTERKVHWRFWESVVNEHVI